jgi:hypothetical protein
MYEYAEANHVRSASGETESFERSEKRRISLCLCVVTVPFDISTISSRLREQVVSKEERLEQAFQLIQRFCDTNKAI